MQPACEGEGTEETAGLREELEVNHVHSVYSQIARHFSDTRYKPWPKVAQFLLELPPGSLIADVGCGNGKYMNTFVGGHTVGCDICPELVSIAGRRGHEVTIASCLSLPFRSDWFDAAICIAVVHHLSTAARRAAAIRELVRVVREGGKMLVYVWAMEQERKKFVQQDVMVPWQLQPQYVSGGRETGDGGGGRGGGGGEGGEKVKKKRLNKKQRAKMRKCQAAEEMKEKKEEEEGEEGSDARRVTEEKDTEKFVTPDHMTSKEDHLINKPDSRKPQTFLRYYHVFREHELSTLISGVGGVNILEEFYDHENWCVIAEKITDQSNHRISQS